MNIEYLGNQKLFLKTVVSFCSLNIHLEGDIGCIFQCHRSDKGTEFVIANPLKKEVLENRVLSFHYFEHDLKWKRLEVSKII